MIFRIKENMRSALMFHIMRLKFIHSSSKGSEKTHCQLLLGAIYKKPVIYWQQASYQTDYNPIGIFWWCSYLTYLH